MSDWLQALLLGVIEGITEFLPISSTGHLLIAERWLGARSDLFNISIQAGAILAVVAIYRTRLWQLLRAFVGAPAQVPPVVANDAAGSGQSPRDYAYKLLLAFGVTAVLGVAVKLAGFELPTRIAPVAWALIIGGGWMLLAESFAAHRALRLGERTAITWVVALLVGVAQVAAGVFPGTSRSGAAIFVALIAGTTQRAAATEFVFLVGIPTMFAATGFELVDVLREGGVGAEDWGLLAIAFVASALTAFVAVKWLLRYIQTHRFTAFAIYRILLGGALLWWLARA